MIPSTLGSSKIREKDVGESKQIKKKKLIIQNIFKLDFKNKVGGEGERSLRVF